MPHDAIIHIFQNSTWTEKETRPISTWNVYTPFKNAHNHRTAARLDSIVYLSEMSDWEGTQKDY